MKTKNIILLVSCLLLFVGTASTQTYYYDATKTFYENGYVYQCDNDGGNIMLYNKQPQFAYADKTYKDGSQLPEDMYTGRVSAIEMETWSRPKARSIVNDAFSTQEKTTVKGRRFVVTIYIDPDTGKVTEVVFRFSARSPYARIPPSTYYKIEQRLKKEIWFIMTDAGKQLNYALLTWEHEVE
jgi:hypothetical protein